MCLPGVRAPPVCIAPLGTLPACAAEHVCLVLCAPTCANFQAWGVGRLPTIVIPARVSVPTRGTGRGPPAHAVPWVVMR